MASKRELMQKTAGYLKASVAKQATALRAKKINPDIFEQVLLNALVANPALAECNKVSLYKACADAVDFGVLPDGRHGAIVPLAGKAEFWPMLAGLLSKVRREMPNISINAWPVFVDMDGNGDEFEDHRGTDPRIVHRPDPDVARSDDNLYAVYAVVFHAGNPVPEFEVLYRPEIDQFRKNNKGPWTTHFVRMAVARPLKRLMNRLPLTGTTMAMLSSDPDHDPLDGQTIQGDYEVLNDPPAADRDPDPDPPPEEEKPASRRRRPPRRQQPAQPAAQERREPDPPPPEQEEEEEEEDRTLLDQGGGDPAGMDDDYDPTQDLA